MEEGFKFGVRSERLGKSIHFGIGGVWYDEKALVLGFLIWEIYVGKVYDLGN